MSVRTTHGFQQFVLKIGITKAFEPPTNRARHARSVTAFPLRLMGQCTVYSLGGRIVGVIGGVTCFQINTSVKPVGLCKVGARRLRMLDGEWIKADDAMWMMQ